MPCLIVRNDQGNLCGYVGVGPEHPLHGIEYGEETEKLAQALECRKDQPLGEHPSMSVMLGALCGELKASPDTVFNVHGGLTYSGSCVGRICHVPREGEPDSVWWFGFDCGHVGDLSPGHVARDSDGGEYRTVAYVRKEVESLARQLVEIK